MAHSSRCAPCWTIRHNEGTGTMSTFETSTLQHSNGGHTMKASIWTRIIKDAARNLASEEGENPEYDRALVELAGELLGYSTSEDREYVENLLGIKKH